MATPCLAFTAHLAFLRLYSRRLETWASDPFAHDPPPWSASDFQAMDHDAVLHTADTDFVRFQGLRWFNPITGRGTASLRRTKTT
jgi:hypothetical protein